jgi:4-hydroxy-2-oxoheptanedioate aldolase
MKARLRAGKKVLGFWSNLNSPLIAEIIAMTGMDFIVFDQEHGFGDPASLVSQLQALSATETTSIVRVPSNDPIYIKRVLDAGVEGVMVPSVETAEQARSVVAACAYPPRGQRGSAVGSARAANYGMAAGYAMAAADELLIVCQIESELAVRNIDEIASVPGVDVLFIGPYDLSASVGLLGQVSHPVVTELIAEAVRGIKTSGKALGSVPHPGRTWRDMMEAGYEVVNAGSDVRCLRDAGRSAVQEFRASFA